MRGLKGVTVKYRLFGRKSGLRVSELALGTGNFGAKKLGSSAKKVFEAYHEAGGRFIDTAEGYQSGRSEELIGEFISKNRDKFVIASKYSVGQNRDEEFSIKGNSRKAMMIAVEGSLRRLKTDYIDLYTLHAHDGVTPMEEILRGLDDLIRNGKIRYAGISNFPAWRIARGDLLGQLGEFAPITAISIEYGISERTAERDLLPMAESLGIGVSIWSPLGGGFLARNDDPAGKPPQSHLDHWTGTGRPNAHDIQVLNEVRLVAKELGQSPARISYAWLLDKARSSMTALIPIIGASAAEQVEDIVSALAMTLSPEHILRLNEASSISLGEPHNHNKFHDGLVNGSDYYSPPFLAP